MGGGCLFTQNAYYIEQFIDEADLGMVGINVGVCAPHPYMPFGGIKDSLVGNNKVQGKEGFDLFTLNKVATVRVTAPAGGLSAEASAGDTREKKEDKPRVRSCIVS